VRTSAEVLVGLLREMKFSRVAGQS
jgi:hypothetical protein